MCIGMKIKSRGISREGTQVILLFVAINMYVCMYICFTYSTNTNHRKILNA